MKVETIDIYLSQRRKDAERFYFSQLLSVVGQQDLVLVMSNIYSSVAVIAVVKPSKVYSFASKSIRPSNSRQVLVV